MTLGVIGALDVSDKMYVFQKREEERKEEEDGRKVTRTTRQETGFEAKMETERRKSKLAIIYQYK